MPSPISNPCPPDVKELFTRLQALEDLEDVQASQATRLTDLERQAFLLQEQRIAALEQRNAELEARIAELERTRHRRKPSTGGQPPEPPISS